MQMDDRNERYSEKEATRRVEKALRAAFNTPAKPQSEMKLGKPKVKSIESPAKSEPSKRKTR
jgi:hypothetical protein